MAFKVSDEFRTNELSLTPGGYTVIVTKTNGKIYEYDKIKKPYAYIRKVSEQPDVKTASVKLQ